MKKIKILNSLFLTILANAMGRLLHDVKSGCMIEKSDAARKIFLARLHFGDV